jgi:predicted DNA-binding transcriptional regulator AlpA
MTPKYLTCKAAAEFLGLKPGTLATWRSEKRGPKYFKIGRACFYAPADLDAWIQKQAVETEAA